MLWVFVKINLSKNLKEKYQIKRNRIFELLSKKIKKNFDDSEPKQKQINI